MQKSGIEWTDYVANPVKGVCSVGCSYCYARKFYEHYKTPPFDDPTIRYDAKAWDGLDKIKKPSRIFVGSTIDLFCDEVKDEWLDLIIYWITQYPKHTFIILTKRPKRMRSYFYARWGAHGISNVWLGVTVTHQEDADERIPILLDIPAAVHFVSAEPLLGETYIVTGLLDWIIIGGLSPTAVHKKEWVDAIVGHAQASGVPLFLKDNLKYDHRIRQFPEGIK